MNISIAVIWGELSFSLALITATVIVGCKMLRRNKFVLRAVLCVVSCIMLPFAFRICFNYFPRNIIKTMFIVKFFISYLLVIFSIFVCFKCNFWAALFCGTAGYCLQHITQRISAIFIITALVNTPDIAQKIFLICETAVVYFLIYFFVVRKIIHSHSSFMVDNKIQIITAAVVVVFTIVINTIALTSNETSNIIYNYLFSVMCAALALIIEFSTFSLKITQNERDTIKRLLHEEREQYLQEKENIELINIKCHDLKHQLSSYSEKIADAELKEISQAVGIYDSAIKTGNEAIDIILSKKSLYCYSNKIRLTCLINGKQLDFIPDHELYSLFGNAVENAIESVRGLAPEKRVITISEKVYGEYINIIIENYFSGDIMFSNGLPQTMKNKQYHGFGMKSMSLLAEKHGGRIYTHINGDIFTLNIFVPLQAQNNNDKKSL